MARPIRKEHLLSIVHVPDEEDTRDEVYVRGKFAGAALIEYNANDPDDKYWGTYFWAYEDYQDDAPAGPLAELNGWQGSQASFEGKARRLLRKKGY